MIGERKLLHGRKVVVADDEPFNLSIVVRMMRELGCQEIVSVVSGSEALVVLDAAAKAPDLAIIDFNMPGSNGLQILKKLRIGDLPLARETKMIMLTGSSDLGLVGAAMALDVDAFVVKPVSLQTMAGRIEKVLSQRSELKEPGDYAKIDIEEVAKRLLSRKPVGLAKPSAPVKRKAGPSGIPMRLEAVKPGTMLSEDVRGPGGELLIGKGTTLSERLIRRLQELQTVLKLEFIYVFPPPVADPET